jgi:hypothetical protein
VFIVLPLKAHVGLHIWLVHTTQKFVPVELEDFESLEAASG